MRCTRCEFENPSGIKFCGQCTAPLALICPKCQFENPPGFKFCGQCTAPLQGDAATTKAKSTPEKPVAAVRVAAGQADASTLEGERKTVTALFADIKGSTELEQDLDPEEARAIVDPALKLMIDAVRHYDGYVVQSTGDGIFAMFGAPLAHEDHPQRAIHCAMRMQERVRRYADRLRSEGRAPLQIRVGANTGEVVVRSIRTGEAKTEYTAIGHPVNLASRMQTLADPGSTVITESTRKLVEGYFSLKSLGASRVKGVTEPVNVYEVTGLGPLRTRLQRAVGRGLVKFVGRQREMDILQHAAEQAKAGHGQIVAAMAEPGVGKSRLFYEFKATSRSGWMVLKTFSVSHGKASTFLPVIDLLRGYFDVRSEDDSRKRREKIGGKALMLDRTLEDTLPYLFGLLGIEEGADPLAQMDTQVKKRRTLDAIKRILLRESLNQPLMVEFEDLHWIDDETQALLNLLADSIGTARILLMVNYRPEYHHEWNSKTYYTQLRLDPLGRESADEMLSSLIGDGKDLIPLKRLIIEKTEGTPLFMEEIVDMLLEEGALVRNGSVKLARSMNQLKIPPTVQDILASRIDRLPPDEKNLLQTLAVIGMEFTFGLVQGVVSKSRDELDGMLHALQLAEFIYEQPAVGDTEYIFKHAQTREVAYNSILNERRKLLHERIGAAIEALFAQSIDDRLSQLAHHYSHSSNTEKTVEYLDRAGQQAMKRGALRQAELYSKQAIATLNTVPETSDRIQREFDLQLRLLSLLTLTSGYATVETEEASTRLQELGEKSGNLAQLISVWMGVWTLAWGRGKMIDMLRIADQVLVIAERTGGSLDLTAAHIVQGCSRFARGDLTGSEQHFKARIASYQEADFAAIPTDAHVSALAWMGLNSWHFGMADTGRAKTDEAISLAERLKKSVSLCDALEKTYIFYMYLRRPEKVQECAERVITLASEQQLPDYLAYASVYRGWAMAEQGRINEGIVLMRDGLDSVVARGRHVDPLALNLMSEALANAGQLDEAMTTIQRALSVGREAYFALPGMLLLRGELHLRRGDESKATEDFHEAIAVGRRIGSKAYELRATTSLARLLDRQGKRDEAHEMLAKIYNQFTEGFDTPDLKDAKALLEELRM